VRLYEERLCCLVIVGVLVDGQEELVVIQDGHRQSKNSWADLLRDAKRRGMRVSVLAVGDGALGFWAAHCATSFPREAERCCVHASANKLKSLPKSAQPGAHKAAEIRDARGPLQLGNRDHGLLGRDRAAPKAAVEEITNKADELLALPGRALGAPEKDQSHIGPPSPQSASGPR